MKRNEHWHRQCAERNAWLCEHKAVELASGLYGVREVALAEEVGRMAREFRAKANRLKNARPGFPSPESCRKRDGQ
jgi:hypothetical protein